MNEISDQELVRLNGAGFIPGPEEEEGEYRKRVEYCLNLREKLAGKLPFDQSCEGGPEDLRGGLEITKKMYDLHPDWITLFYSNYKLPPWHGGCAWIFRMDDASPTASLFQLRKEFRQKDRLWGLYKRDEIIAHELVHASRMMFEEPQFEEILACGIFDSRLRRYFGAMVQNSFESMLFIFALGGMLILDFFLIASGFSFESLIYTKAIPLALILAGWGRLRGRQKQLERCREKLKTLTDHPDAVLCRLTDKEIKLFGEADVEEILSYAEKEKSLRWRAIAAAYKIPVK